MHYWRALRPQQWIKNAFVWAGFLFGHVWHEPMLAAQVAAAFVAFCFLASAVYIGNDWIDRDADRVHPLKRDRPIAAGRGREVDSYLARGDEGACRVPVRGRAGEVATRYVAPRIFMPRGGHQWTSAS